MTKGRQRAGFPPCCWCTCRGPSGKVGEVELSGQLTARCREPGAASLFGLTNRRAAVCYGVAGDEAARAAAWRCDEGRAGLVAASAAAAAHERGAQVSAATVQAPSVGWLRRGFGRGALEARGAGGMREVEHGCVAAARVVRG